MEQAKLPQSTIEYLNSGAPAGQAREALQSAAIHYQEAGYEEFIALEDLMGRAEEDGLTERDAEYIIRSVFKGKRVVKIPPRAETFRARRRERSRGRYANSIMKGRVIPKELPQPMTDPAGTFFRVAFEAGEIVHLTGQLEDGTVEESGIMMPYEALINLLDIGEGDANHIPVGCGLGAFVGINPYKSRESTRQNSHVAQLRHLLVEFDDLSKEEQWSLLEASRLPLSVVIDSGGKSLHGWVRVEAENKAQYDKAVAEVFDFFEGYPVKVQNKNPSRLSRLPGVSRGTAQQELLAINIGVPSFSYWLRWRAKEPEVMSWEEIDAAEIERPELLIAGILHRGSKMTIGGGSKSMKSWALADLGVSVATGQPWWGNETVMGNVLMIDFELNRYFWRERVRSIIAAKDNLKPAGLDVLPMRGRMADFEMVRRYVMEACDQKDYAMIILDPIYKCLGGRDENLAGDVAELMNEVESLTLDTGAAVVIAAHYSKGNQAAKDSLDRISGSGVFARDPDTILAMTKHEEEGSFTVDVTVRNFEPIKPFVVSWGFPLMHRNKELDPEAIKLPPHERAKMPKVTVAMFVKEFRGLAGMKKDEMKEKAMEVFGIGKSKFYELFKELERSGQLTYSCGYYKIKERSQ